MIRRIVPTAALACAVVLATAGCTVNPVTGKSQLDLMGEAHELQLGKSLYPRYTESSLGKVQEPQLQTYVDRVGLRLASVSHRPNLPWEYNAVNDPAVNAYALPGGKISITRGLLSRMDNEDELAGVLGHETGHVTARHAAVAYTRNMLTQLALIGGMAYMEVKDTKNRNLYAFGGMLG
ncbi:MAG TPA: peptidase M48 Ste24p, partial [Acidobacteria bacterium]|nr:peptidase M48 Ste24p [Acidobacteriota bacterium]